MPNRPTVFVCDAEPASIAGLRWFLGETSEFEVIGEASTVSATLAAAGDLRPDILLIDHVSGVRSTLHFLSELMYVSPSTGCLLWVRDMPEAELVRAFRAGAKGFLRKTSPLSTLLGALRQVKAGETFLEESASPSLRQWAVRRHLPRLTPREREIIELVSKGMKNREIAAHLSITPGTVKVHLMHVFEKTGTRHRYELAVRSARLLLETDPGPIVRQTA
ncbi:MAG TPA: response regulator transcription factor [Bryobacteraceae bacterium]|nr:response regulator transcription factor [Bryobacteraceae bacterium]